MPPVDPVQEYHLRSPLPLDVDHFFSTWCWWDHLALAWKPRWATMGGRFFGKVNVGHLRVPPAMYPLLSRGGTSGRVPSCCWRRRRCCTFVSPSGWKRQCHSVQEGSRRCQSIRGMVPSAPAKSFRTPAFRIRLVVALGGRWNRTGSRLHDIFRRTPGEVEGDGGIVAPRDMKFSR